MEEENKTITTASGAKTKKPKVVTIRLTAEEKNNSELAKGRVISYEVPPDELNSIHAEIEQVAFRSGGASAGTKTSSPFIQKFDPRAWANFRNSARALGWSHVRVLYAPPRFPKKDLIIPEVKKA